jgi:hypothetical protein
MQLTHFRTPLKLLRLLPSRTGRANSAHAGSREWAGRRVEAPDNIKDGHPCD